MPPPLVGIWARWSYLHNNSGPTLCDMFKPAKDRPIHYYAAEAIDKEKHFDFKCNAYPRRKTKGAKYMRFTKSGLRNIGHERRDFDRQDRKGFVQPLQTL